MRFVLASIVVAMCAGVSRASTLDLVLGTPAPAGTVVLSGSALPSPYQGGVNAYDGVLNWTELNNSSVTYSTYCIDVASVISINNPYQFNLVDLASSGLYDSKVINAVENLWAQHPVEGNVGLALGPNIYASNAATFQTALWDIIQNHYDKNGNPVATPTLNFSSPGQGFTNTDLANAFDWSAAAYAAGTYTGPNNFAALVATDGGQNQAMFMVNMGSQIIAVPTPSACAGGVALMAALAFIRRGLRRQVN
jgi:hypothetical protein